MTDRILAADFRKLTGKAVKAKPARPVKPHSDPETEPELGSAANPYDEPEAQKVLTSAIMKIDGYQVNYHADKIECINLKDNRTFLITIKQVR